MTRLLLVILFLALVLTSPVLPAHPMGNFSISHYSRLNVTANGLRVTYVLDFAEIPTFELYQKWGITGKSGLEIQTKSESAAREWASNLGVLENGRARKGRLSHVFAQTVDGAAGMPQLRVEMVVEFAGRPGAWEYDDRNFATRTGWKEIVVRAEDGVVIAKASHRDLDMTQALTVYPMDVNLTPPQDLRATVEWSAPKVVSSAQKPSTTGTRGSRVATVPEGRAVSAEAPAPPPSFSAQGPQAVPGAVVQGDFLSRMLKEKSFTPGMILLGLLVAFGLGAMHALSPGHGKTIVAAYLVGTRGTLRHAALLGALVTFTHTASVFLLGLGVLFFEQYVAPEKVIPVLSAVSGLSIVAIGTWLLYQRTKVLLAVSADHSHSHEDGHEHSHTHDHAHEPGHAHVHESREVAALVHANGHADERGHRRGPGHYHEQGHHHEHGFLVTHSHGGHTHSHGVPEGNVTLGGLVALGVSGGLVPCPSALILLLSAIALGHVGIGLVLLISFSGGLALVLMAIGALVIYAKNLLPESGKLRQMTLFRLAPIFSAVVVMILGLLMTLVAVGLIPANRFLS